MSNFRNLNSRASAAFLFYGVDVGGDVEVWEEVDVTGTLFSGVVACDEYEE